MSLATVRAASIRLAQVSAIAISLAGATAFGGALPVLYAWNPELAETLPVTSTFTRASTSQVLTTTDGTTNWYQEAKSGELRLDGLRREETFSVGPQLEGFVGLNGCTIAGDNSSFTYPGVSDGEQAQEVTGSSFRSGDNVGIRLALSLTSGTADIQVRFFGGFSSNTDISLTTSRKIFWVVGTMTIDGGVTIQLQNRSSGGPFAITVNVHELSIHKVQTSSSPPPDFVDATVTYNAEVSAVRYFNTANGNSVDGSSVVTEATGTTITGGGYLPETAATNQIDDNDLSGGAWASSGITETDNGVNSIGLHEYELDDGVGVGVVHRTRNDASSAAANSSAYLIVKPGTGRYIIIQKGIDYSVYDLTGIAVTEQTAGVVTATIDLVSDGYYKCFMQNASSDATFRISLSDTGTPGTANPVYTGSNRTYLVCHEQWENTVFSTSPIITSGSTVTRVADVLSASTTVPSPYSVFLDVTGASVVVNDAFMGFGGAGNQQIAFNSTTNLTAFNGVTLNNTKLSGTWADSRIKVGVNFETNNGIMAATDTVTSTDSTGTVAAQTTVYTGSRSLSDRQFRGRVHNVIVYGAAQTQSQLEALVA